MNYNKRFGERGTKIRISDLSQRLIGTIIRFLVTNRLGLIEED